jgi:hypothetical protein
MRHALSIAASCALCTLCGLTPARAETPSAQALAPLPAASAADTGTSTSLFDLSWNRVQGRLAFSTQSTPLRSRPDVHDHAFALSSLSVMGDYYLRPTPSAYSLSGLRATGGFVFGPRTSLWGMSGSSRALSIDQRSSGYDPTGSGVHNDPLSTSTYLGIGYSGVRRSWGFTADVGIMSTNPGSIGRVGRVVNGSRSFDDVVRDLRLSPVLQFGFSYEF